MGTLSNEIDFIITMNREKQSKMQTIKFAKNRNRKLNEEVVCFKKRKEEIQKEKEKMKTEQNQKVQHYRERIVSKRFKRGES